MRVDRWGPFVFANLDADAPPLREQMGAIPAEVARAGYDVEHMRLIERREYLIECNWKVYVDNYLEGYHLPIAHPDLFRELDYDSYRVETFRYYSKQHAPIRELKEGEELGRDRRYVRTADGEGEALYYWLFPNTMFNIYPDNMSSNVILPVGVDRTLTIFEWFFAEPGSGPGWESMQQGIAFSDQIQQEDIVLCEQVQRGLRSRAYDSGRFSARSARTASSTSSSWCASSSTRHDAGLTRSAAIDGRLLGQHLGGAPRDEHQADAGDPQAGRLGRQSRLVKLPDLVDPEQERRDRQQGEDT